jgi:hypothetical protein
MSEEAVIDAEAVEIGTELAPVAPPAALFKTDDPAEVLARATAAADALKGVLDRQGLTSSISGRKFVKVEGWTTLAAMMGVSAVCTETETLTDGFRATVEARMPDGRVVGSADALCTRAEKTWSQRDDYALLSMAQTRATSKALRIPLGFVVTLAGYESTPADEMPAQASPSPQGLPFGPATGDDILKQTRAALGFLLDKEPASLEVTGVLAKVSEATAAPDSGEPYLPYIASYALCMIATAVKERPTTEPLGQSKEQMETAMPMTPRSGVPCARCNGKGHITRNGDVKECAKCLGTGTVEAQPLTQPAERSGANNP